MRGVLVGALLLAGCGFTASGIPDLGSDAGDGSAGHDASTPPQPDGNVTPPGPQCPAGYSTIAVLGNSDSRYRFVTTAAQWDQAEADCEDDFTSGQRATHLIVLDGAVERGAMIGGAASNLSLNDQWIGATDLEREGDVRYVTAQQQTLSIQNPAGNMDNKDCIRIKNTTVAEARSCTEANAYVCECDGRAADPNRYPNFPNGNNDSSEGGPFGGGGGGIGGGP